MPAIGITGGVATGKSTFCDCLCEILPAAKFFDADRTAHELVDLPEVREELIREFGEKILSGTGDLLQSTRQSSTVLIPRANPAGITSDWSSGGSIMVA